MLPIIEPQLTTSTIFVEPFCGSSIVSFNVFKKNKNIESHINDLDPLRIKFYKNMTQEKEIWMDLPLGEASLEVRARVDQAWGLQHTRQGGLNARLSDSQIDRFCTMNTEAKKILDLLIDKYFLSARAIQRVRRVARTIADLDARKVIEAQHFAEAFQYRFKPL